MCTNDFAKEELSNGGSTIDSVASRVMTQQDGCTCVVNLQNQTKIYTVYMRKYDLLTSAGPKQDACGLAIDIGYTSVATFPDDKAPIECTRGMKTRSVSLSQNGVLHLRSRIIGGNFITGYCIQIYRFHTTGDNVNIQINCSYPNIPTEQQITDDTIQDKPVSSDKQTTQQMTDAAIQDKTVSENVNISIPVIIATVIGCCLIVLLAITVCYFYRRKRKSQPSSVEEENVNPQYVDLNATRLSSCYSSLNTSTVLSSAEQYEHIGLPSNIKI